MSTTSPVKKKAARAMKRPKFLDSDLAFDFFQSKVTIVATLIIVIVVFCSTFAPWIAPHDAFDPATLELINSELPPAWYSEGRMEFLLGTDSQGRDVLSAILFGTRASLIVGFASTILSVILGVGLGLVSGYNGGAIDAFIMRAADVMLSFPAILVALLISGIARAILPIDMRESAALFVIIFSISMTTWVQYARIIRGTTMIEQNKEYVQASKIIGLRPIYIVLSHILPNIIGPVMVVATINLSSAVLLEASLSFLGVGMPPTHPSLGSLIRSGNEFLFSGIWWVVVFPSLMLVLIVLSVNLLGDWLREALNPKLR